MSRGGTWRPPWGETPPSRAKSSVMATPKPNDQRGRGTTTLDVPALAGNAQLGADAVGCRCVGPEGDRETGTGPGRGKPARKTREFLRNLTRARARNPGRKMKIPGPPRGGRAQPGRTTLARDPGLARSCFGQPCEAATTQREKHAECQAECSRKFLRLILPNSWSDWRLVLFNLIHKPIQHREVRPSVHRSTTRLPKDRARGDSHRGATAMGRMVEWMSRTWGRWSSGERMGR